MAANERRQGLRRQSARLAEEDKQAEGSLAEGAGYIGVVAGLQRAAVEHSRAGDRAQGGQAERHRARRRGGVAAVERDFVARLILRSPFGKAGDPVLPDRERPGRGEQVAEGPYWKNVV